MSLVQCALALCFAAFVVSGNAAQGQSAPFTTEMKAKIDAAVQQVLAETGTPSAQIGIAEHGEVVFTGAYGLARIDPPVSSTVELRSSR